MQGVPFDHVANAAILIVEKILVGRGEVLSGIQSHLLVAAAQNQGVQFEEHAQLPEREQLDLAVDQLLDENVSAQHMVDREAVEGFARAADLRIDRCEIRLYLAKRSFNRWKVEIGSFPTGCGEGPGQGIPRKSRRDCLADYAV